MVRLAGDQGNSLKLQINQVKIWNGIFCGKMGLLGLENAYF
jgi:hypothetical protein